MRKISKDNPLPLHYQIKEILQEMIENEELKPGDPIYTERELCEIQGVSRMTVNKAIMSLVNEGILYRQQGRGTFVARPKVNQQLSKLKGFTEEMQDKGLKCDTRVLNFQVKRATKQNKMILKLPDSEDMIIEINRLRMSNGQPVAIENVWIPYYMFRDMTREMIDGQSLYEVFRTNYKCFPSKAKQTIEPTKVNDYEADLLELENESLALLFRRTTFDDKDRPIEYTKSIYRSDNYRYEVILT